MIILASLIRYELHCDLMKKIARGFKSVFSWRFSKQFNKKISARKRVEEETVLLASDAPDLGVNSVHSSELDSLSLISKSSKSRIL